MVYIFLYAFISKLNNLEGFAKKLYFALLCKSIICFEICDLSKTNNKCNNAKGRTLHLQKQKTNTHVLLYFKVRNGYNNHIQN